MPVTTPSAEEIAFRRAQSNIGKPAPTARYVPSYASPAATQRQETANTAAGVNRTPTGRGAPPVGNGTSGNTDNTTDPTAQTRQRAAVGPYQDSTYNAQIASINRALQDYETGATTRGQRYGIDYNTGLQKLGYRPQEGFNPIDIGAIFEPATAASATPMALSAQGSPAGVGVQGAFDIEGQYDPYSAAAQGTRSRRDDFASRGMLRSSDFTKNFGEFQQRLNEQLGAMETGRSRFAEDMSTEVAQQRTSAEERRQSAQRDAENRAIMRAIQESGF
jgi:hypothetical protein